MKKMKNIFCETIIFLYMYNIQSIDAFKNTINNIFLQLCSELLQRFLQEIGKLHKFLSNILNILSKIIQNNSFF